MTITRFKQARRGRTTMTITRFKQALCGSRSVALAVAALFVGLVAASCASESASDNGVALEPLAAEEPAAAPAASTAIDAAPGVIYFTTSGGQLQALTPSTGDQDLIWDTTDASASVVFEVAPSNAGDGVQALLAGQDTVLDTSLSRIENGQLVAAEDAESFAGAVCLDTHAAGAFTVGHVIQPSLDNTQGLGFTAVVLGSGTSAPALSRKSTFCPRYDSTREIVATSNLTTAGDVRTETLFVDTLEGSHQVAVEGCGLTQRAFSPDDSWLLVSVICYDDQWADSGLYALPVAELFEVQGLAEMHQMAAGNFGRTTWHEDGFWLAASAVAAQPQQTPDIDLSDLPVEVVVINTDGQLFQFDALGSDQPHSLVWATADVHTSS